MNPNVPKIQEQEFSVNFNPKTTIELDTFSVQTVKRDPFLGTLQSNKNRTKKGNAKPDFKWPIITYQGVVEDKNSNSGQIFIVSVNGKQSLLKRGKSFSDVFIVKGNKKELIVRYKGKLKTISLKK